MIFKVQKWLKPLHKKENQIDVVHGVIRHSWGHTSCVALLGTQLMVYGNIHQTIIWFSLSIILSLAKTIYPHLSLTGKYMFHCILFCLCHFTCHYHHYVMSVSQTIYQHLALPSVCYVASISQTSMETGHLIFYNGLKGGTSL